MPELEYFRGRDLLGMEMLAQVATNLILRYSAAPSRGNVRLRITPRIVRHYLNEDLLGEPSGQMGTAMVFNYGNLLRLLAVKKLLVENWSIEKIRELTKQLDITALEAFVSGTSDRDSRSVPQTEPGDCNTGARDRLARGPTDGEKVRSAVTLFPPARPAKAVVSDLGSPASAHTEADWVELAPGLEMRVRRGFRSPETETDRRRILERFNALAFGGSATGDRI